MIRSLFIPFDGQTPALAALQYACWLASHTEGRIYAGRLLSMPAEPLLVTDVIPASIDYLAPSPVVSLSENIARVRQEHEDEDRTILAEARQICAGWNVPCRASVIVGDYGDELIRQGLGVDLLVMSRRGLGLEDQEMEDLLAGVLREAVQPVLVAADHFAAPDGVVALFDGGGRALHALGQAVDLALRAKLPLRVLTAAEAGPEARTLTERAQRYMADHQIEGQVKLIPLEGEGEPVLLEELLDAPQALIAMGAFGRPRVREWISGSTTLRILRDTANPILFYPF